MMKFNIVRQDSYSRGELLLRAFFGIFYIALPHGIVSLFLAIGLMFIRMLTFWVILFTGKFPKSWFEYNVKFMRYQIRVAARNSNMADGYPAFGLNGTDTQTYFDVTYQEEVSRGSMLLRAFFGPLMVFPHMFILVFRMIGVAFIQMIIFWVILFTGNYPQGMFDFVLETNRWQHRVACYLAYLTHTYPPFTGKVLPGEETPEMGKKSSDDVLDA